MTRQNDRAPDELRPTTITPEFPAARRRLRADRSRTHARHLHGQRRGSRAAVSARQRQGLGDSRVRDAAARDEHSHDARSGAGQGRRPHDGDPAADWPVDANASCGLPELGERTVWIDCDVIQADGGTRTASITGAFVALVLALHKLKQQDQLRTIPDQRLRRRHQRRHRRRHAAARPRVRRGLESRRRHEHRQDRRRTIHRDPGHRGGGTVRPRCAATACLNSPIAASRSSIAKQREIVGSILGR